MEAQLNSEIDLCKCGNRKYSQSTKCQECIRLNKYKGQLSRFGKGWKKRYGTKK